MFDAADLAAFVDPSMPGYVQALIDGQPVGGLFRSNYAESFGMVGGHQPVFRCLEQFSVGFGSTVMIGLVAYTVAEIEPAEPGFQLLKLESA